MRIERKRRVNQEKENVSIDIKATSPNQKKKVEKTTRNNKIKATGEIGTIEKEGNKKRRNK